MKRTVFLLLFLIACTPAIETNPTPQQPPLKPLTGVTPSGTATTSDGQTIAYQLYPNKKGSAAIILLHMLGRSRTDWDSVARWLQKNGYTVIVPDLRGHGLSTGDFQKFTPDDFNKMTLDVAAVKSVLENQGVDIKRLVIIGASIGANIALSYAAEDPDVATVILLSPGLEFRGVKTSTAITKFNKPLLVVASADDQYSAQTAQELASKNVQVTLKMYDNAGHGTNMFVKNDLAPGILTWLKGHV